MDCHQARIFRATQTPSLVISANHPEYTIQDVTNSFIEATGEKRENLIGQSIFSFFSGSVREMPDRLLEALKSINEHRKPIKTEGIDYKINSDILNPYIYFFCDLESTPLIEDLENDLKSINWNEFSILISLSNITSYKKDNEKIRISNEAINKELLSGTWEFDNKTNLYSCSEEVYKIYGVEPGAFTTSMDFIQQFTHPNDLEKRNRIINYATSTATEYYLAYRIIRWDKQMKNLVSIGFPKKDLDGNLIGYEGIIKEVGSKIQIEIKLFETIFELQKKNKLIEKLITNIPVGIAINKISTGETTLINHEFGNLYGWSSHELKDFNSFLEKAYPDEINRKEVADKIFNDIRNGESAASNWREEVINNKSCVLKVINAKNIPVPEHDLLITTAIDVTEKELLFQELKLAIERHNLVSKATDDAVFDWDIERDEIFWKNSVLTNSLGFKDGTARNNLIQWVAGIHPDDVEEFQNSLNEFLSNNSNNNWEPNYYRIIKADGTFFYIKGLAHVIRNKEGNAIRMVGVLRDVTRRKEEELRLKLLEAVVENMGDPVVMTEADPIELPGPRIIYANPAYLKLTGYTLQEIIGMTPRILQGEMSNKEELKKLKEALKHFTPYNLSTVNYNKHREPIWISAHINPIFDDKGHCINWVGVQRDVTEERKAVKLMEELNKELINKTDKLEISNKELEQFAYIASHDLQEPLRMITSFLSMIEKRYDHQLDDKGRQYIRFAVDGAKRLRQIILDLLDYSRVGRTEYATETIDLKELLSEVENAMVTRITEQNAILESNGLTIINAKRTPLTQIFQNLVSNALKYSKKGVPPSIRINVEEKKDYWQLSVEDNGIGINKEHHERIFIIFQRLHSKEEISGTGLGLAITKKAIETMGGTIWLESEVGKGSTFYFTIAKANRK